MTPPAGTRQLELARLAYGRRDWVTARGHFRAAREAGPLDPGDIAAHANCAWWLGDLDEAIPLQQEAHRRHLEAGQVEQAALMALETGYTLLLRGEEAQGSGWMSRAASLLAGRPEGATSGYLRYVDFETAFGSGDLPAARRHADAVHDLGARFTDPNLVALGVLGRGRILVREGQVTEGMALLDEAMVAAVSDELAPDWAGNIYCHLMSACEELGDLRRAGEWTAVTARWCESMPGAGPFMGICRVHRAHLLQVQGDWDTAEREAARVCDELAGFEVAVVAEAHYQLGDLRRVRGDLAGAERAYRTAHGLGRDPQPGLSLLRLAQGRTHTAASAIRLALAGEEASRLARARLLPAAVEIALAADDIPAARDWAEELMGIGDEFGTAGLRAPALHASGAVLLAEGAHTAALGVLREALRLWQDLPAPFDVAKTRLLLARAHAALGEQDGADLERAAAQAELERLGAPATASSVVDTATTRADGLSPREAEILELVAAGHTNQQIADHLVLSIRTVERHLATVYRKLGLSGRNARAAAVRYALQDGPGSPAR